MAGKRENLVLFVVICFMISSYSKSFANGLNWQLIQQWLPSVCTSELASDTPCLKPYSEQNKFTISSFFPVHNDGFPFTFCGGPNSPKYESNAIESERSDLDEYWPNVFGKDNEKLWKSEWEKKGVCAYPLINQTEYFKKALEIRKNPKYDLFASLSGSRKTFTKNSAKKLIKKWLKKEVGLRCSRHSRLDDIILLTEIVMCFEGGEFDITDCPDHVDHGCNAGFYWPQGLHLHPHSLQFSIINYH